MRINYIGRFIQTDGYGRFNSRLVQALQEQGVEVKVGSLESLSMPTWLHRQEGFDWDSLTISCVLPNEVKDAPGRQWLFTMLEGSVLPPEWAALINVSSVERVLVPCEANALAFRNAGVLAPVSVVPGGVDTAEFPYFSRYRAVESISKEKPYTFLTLADRGGRKGWEQVREAFYLAFGGKTSGDQKVRLIIKSRPLNYPTPIGYMMRAKGRDERVVFQVSDAPSIQRVYAQADCVALPSLWEGWGMPHREVVSMGIPCIVQVNSGLDDGYTGRWALPLVEGKMVPIPKEHKPNLGKWMIPDLDELAQVMRWARYSPETAAGAGSRGARWLQENQTWAHSAKKLVQLIEGDTHALPMERATLSLFNRVA